MPGLGAAARLIARVELRPRLLDLLRGGYSLAAAKFGDHVRIRRRQHGDAVPGLFGDFTERQPALVQEQRHEAVAQVIRNHVLVDQLRPAALLLGVLALLGVDRFERRLPDPTTPVAHVGIRPRLTVRSSEYQLVVGRAAHRDPVPREVMPHGFQYVD